MQAIFADVFKHITLVGLIQSLLRKDKPFCYIDTHSGIGQYNLLSETARKTGEFSNGIGRLFNLQTTLKLVNDYLMIVQGINTEKTLKYYPGSPVVVEKLLRKTDRMVLSELHQRDYQLLNELFFKNRGVTIYHQDGYHTLKACLPPLEKRGLVLIDPPFEQQDEFNQIVLGLKNALQRWATGIYAVWYPIKEQKLNQNFFKALQQLPIKNCLKLELTVLPDDVPHRLNGSGMVIINCPWQFDTEIQTILPWLWQQLAVEQNGGYKVEWLKKEID